MLIVVGVFAVLGVVMTQTLASSLRGSKKSENLGIVRENVEYAMNYIERTLRMAERLDIAHCGGGTLGFINSNGVGEQFSFSEGKISHGVNQITGSAIVVESSDTTPVFACTQGSSGVPDSVTITITARDSGSNNAAESARYTTQTTISLRNYSRN